MKTALIRSMPLFLALLLPTLWLPKPAIGQEHDPCSSTGEEPAFHVPAEAIQTIAAGPLEIPLQLRPTDKPDMSVYLFGLSRKEVSITHTSSTLSIVGAPAAAGVTIRFHGAPGRSMTAVVNGKEQTIPSTPAPQVVVCVPVGHSPALVAKGTVQLTSSVPFKAAELDLSRNGRATLSNFRGGSLTAALRGVATLLAAGEFQTVQARTDNAARLTTTGTIRAAFAAESRGASAITHRGLVAGPIDKAEAQAGRVTVLPDGA